MRLCYFLGLLLWMDLVHAQNPYLTLQYDSLVIYDFDWYSKDERYRSILDESGKLVPTIKKSVRLSPKDAIELTKAIGDSTSYGQITAACFDPHFGMVYFLQGQPTEHITICMSCNFPKSSLEIPARNQGAEWLDGEVFYTRTGFSKTFRKYLSALKKKHGFSHADLNSQMFDK